MVFSVLKSGFVTNNKNFINKEWLNEKMIEKVSNVINEDGYPKKYEYAS